MSVAERIRPTFDPHRGRVAASARQLDQLATIAAGGAVDDAARAVLVEAGFLGLDGEVIEDVLPVARTAGDPAATVALRRVRLGSARRVEVRWSTDALVGLSPFDDPDRVGQLVIGPPTALARTLWTLAKLGPRPRSAADPVQVSREDGLMPFQGTLTETWAAEVGATAATLLRFEGHIGSRDRVTAIADLGDAGLWRYAPDGTWVPVTSTEVFGELAGLQAALVSGTAFAD